MTTRRRTRGKARTAAIARKNGAKGGPPRAKLPAELLDKLGPPPMGDPLALARWCTDLSSQVFWLSLRGDVAAELEARVRAFKRSVALSMPADVAAELDRLLRADAAAVAADEAGPQPERTDGEPQSSLRAAPR